MNLKSCFLERSGSANKTIDRLSPALGYAATGSMPATQGQHSQPTILRAKNGHHRGGGERKSRNDLIGQSERGSSLRKSQKACFAANWMAYSIQYLSKSFEMGMRLCHAVIQQVTRPLAGRTLPLIPTPRAASRSGGMVKILGSRARGWAASCFLWSRMGEVRLVPA